MAYTKEQQAAYGRAYNLARYGLTPATYDVMLQEQEYACAICGTFEAKGMGRFCVDHDHDTGKVRALLCHNCNSGLGRFYDNSALLQVASDYLSGHKAVA